MKSHSRILVVAAVPQELAHFHTEANGAIRCLVTGMGYAQTLKAVQRFLSTGRYRGVIAAGFSGGTRPGLRVGDLVMPSEVIWASSGERFRPTVKMVSGTILEKVPGTYGTLEGAWHRPPAIGLFVTVKDTVADPLAKAKIGDRYGAIAVDMETAAVARAAGETKIPWMALRAILDPVEVPLGIRSWGMALRAMANPSRWRALKQFLGSVHLASVSLGGGLKNLVGAG